MAGLDDLIEFILDKLALKAGAGATKSEIAAIATEFYQQDTTSALPDKGDGPPQFNIDEQFLEKLIQWLSNHKSVKVFYVHGDTVKNAPATGSSPAKELRLGVTTERMWIAIAGHPPDETKVRPLEFALLSIIAQHGPSGIPQPDLIRLSGQDKRSLPHRTDTLRDRGYIEKKPVSSAGMKTSLCTLSKFVQAAPNVDIEKAISGSENLFSHFVVNGETLLPERFLDISLRVIQKHGLLEVTRFREIMGIGANTSGRKWVKAARKFLAHMVAVGCIQQLSVVFEEKRKKTVNCLKFIQEPSKEARQSICAMSDAFPESIAKSSQDSQAENIQEDESDNEQANPTRANSELVKNDDFEIKGVPSWDPERPLFNQIFDAVNASGTKGLSGLELSTRVCSPFWRRALDHILIQLTELWQVSQPLSLRHLTIVRDSAQKGRVIHYQYYTHEAFSKLVEAGESSWEAVGGDFKNITEPLDEWGFPLVPKSEFLNGNGCATVSEAFNAAKLGKNRGRRAIADLENNSEEDFVEAIAPPPVKDAAERRKLGLKPLGRPPKKASKRQARATQPKSKAKPSSSANAGQHGDLTMLDTEFAFPTTPVNGIPQSHEPGDGESLGTAGQDQQPRTAEQEPDQGNGLKVGRNQLQENLSNSGTASGKKRSRQEIEVARSPSKKPRTSARLHPEENSTIPNRVDDLYAGSVEPRVPGVYMNHPTRSTVRKGSSPTRKLNIVIKSDRLSQFDWFKSSSTSDTNSTHVFERSEEVDGDGLQGSSSRKPTLPGQVLTEPSRGSLDTMIPPAAMLEPNHITQHPRVKGQMEGVEYHSSLPATQHSEGADMEGGLRTHDFLKNGEGPTFQRTTPTSKSKLTQGGTEEDTETVRSGAPQLDDPATSRMSEALTSNVVMSTEGIMLHREEEHTPGYLTMSTKSRNATISEDNRTIPSISVQNGPNESNVSARKSRRTKKNVGNVRKKDQGTVAWKRNKVMLDAIDEVGGMCPGPKELQNLYLHKLASNNTAGQPDLATVSRVVKSLVASGKLKKFGFTFAYNGSVQQGAIFALPHHSVDSDAVRKLQAEVIRLHPKRYMPPGVEGMISTRYQSKSKLSNAGLVAVPRRSRQITSRSISAKQALEELPESSFGFTRWVDRVNGVVSPPRKKRKRDVRDDEETDSDDTPPPSMANLQSSWSLGAVSPDFLSVLSNGDGPTSRKNALSGSSHKRVRFADHSTSKVDKPASRTSNLNRGFHRSRSSHNTLLMDSQDFYPNIGVFTSLFGGNGSEDALQSHPRQLKDSLGETETPRGSTYFAEWPSNTSARKQFFTHLEDREAWEKKHAPELSVDRPTEDDPLYPEGLRFLVHEIPPSVKSQLRKDRVQSMDEDPSQAQQRNLNGVPPQDLTPRPINNAQTPITTARHSQATPRPVNPAWRMSQRAGRICKWRMCKSDLPFPELLREPAILSLVASVITVRTILGGRKQTIDWPLVVKLLGKKYDNYVISSQWKQIEHSHRAQINLLEYSFQQRFLTAYEARAIPRIRFRDMHIYNWNAMKDWTENLLSSLINTDTGSAVAQKLSKRHLSDAYTTRPILVEEQSNDVMFKHQVAITKRTEYMRDTGFFVQVPRVEPVRDETLALAKSLVRAIINTPDATYNASHARDKLSSVPSYALDAAVAELIKAKYIRHMAKGRPMPGRSFGYTDNFKKNLRLHAKHGRVQNVFMKAIKFKEFLDGEFQKRGFYKVPGVADDPQGLVIGSLISEGRLSVKVMTPDVIDDPNYNASAEIINPTSEDNPTRKLSIWGMAKGSYKTSSLDLSHLVFPIRVYPTEAYTNGLPLKQPLPEPPAPHLQANTEYKSIPIWYDINDSLIPTMWNKVGLSVIRLIHQRPGITAAQIVRAMNNVVNLSDVELAQKWLVEVGVVDDSRMKVKEWWWAVFSSGDENETAKN